MQLEASLGRVALLLTLGFLWASCTFPSVEYETVCAVPMACQKDVEACRKQAGMQQMACLSKCTTVCPSCGTDFDQAMNLCVAECEVCSANEGCANATESCKALSGVP